MNAVSHMRRYSAGAVLQIMLFGVLAVQIKRKAPNAHTILEIVRHRWGKWAHWVGIWLCGRTSSAPRPGTGACSRVDACRASTLPAASVEMDRM